MKNEIVKCVRCRNLHSTGDRILMTDKTLGPSWSVSCCPKCNAHATYQVSPIEYEIEVSKQQKKYPALKNEELRPDWILDAYNAGVPPIQFLNGLLDAA